MLSIVVLDTLYEEKVNVSDILKTEYEKRELPIKRLDIFHNVSILRQNIAKHPNYYNVLVVSFDMSPQEYLELARDLRKEKENIFIIFIVGEDVDIASCVRPSIRPAGILFIPLDKAYVVKTIQEIYMEYLRSAGKAKQPIFTIKTGGEYFSINAEEISFFEAQGKKIAVKTRGQEIQFYSNFETILEKLPVCFMRCHKGFVVNMKQIVQANFTDMNLTLRDQSMIPFSRTYKDELRAFFETREE